MAAAKATVKRANGTVFADPLVVPSARLSDFFGPPSRDDPFGISYDLSLWPEHRYYWHIDDGGFASHGGFVLRNEPNIPESITKELAAARAVFRSGYHTMADVERVFGMPDANLSWFPHQTWYYGPLVDGTYLGVHFDLGLLREVATEDGAVVERLAGDNPI